MTPIQVRSLAEWEAAGIPDLLSVVIPAHNERGHIESTVREIVSMLDDANIAHEVLIVNDNSVDDTEEILRDLSADLESVRYVNNLPPHGYGFAVRRGLAEFRGETVAIVMADGSDDPGDLVAFYMKHKEGYDCVFGTRFARGGKALDYPWPKLILNRLANRLIQIVFFVSCNDMTNAFKMFHRSVIAGLQPILSQHFNLTVELPLKAVVRGYSYAVVPNTWRNRETGVSKFRIREMGGRYVFIILYCLLERLLSRSDYRGTEPGMRENQLQVWPR